MACSQEPFVDIPPERVSDALQDVLSMGRMCVARTVGRRISLVETEANPFRASGTEKRDSSLDHTSIELLNLSDAKPIQDIDLKRILEILNTLE